MRAAVLTETRRIDIREIEDLRPSPDEVLIETAFAGVCGSDLHAFVGKHPFRKPPVVLGHELSGRVIAVGEQASGRIRPGDRVTVMPLVACGACAPCRAGRENLCLQKQVPGLGAWPGSFADRFVAKAAVTFRIADGTSLQRAVLAEPLAVGIHGVRRRARVSPGARVLVLGAGTIGILTACAARAAGAETLVVTDLFEFNLAMVAALCKATVVSASRAGWDDDLLAAHPEGFDAAFLCSGAASTVGQAMRLVRRGGRIIVTGMFLEPVPVNLLAVNLNELELVGAVVYDQHDFREAVDWIDGGRFEFERLITHTMPLERAQDALELIAGRSQDVVKILLSAGS